MTLNDQPGLQCGRLPGRHGPRAVPGPGRLQQLGGVALPDVRVRQAFEYGCDRAGLRATPTCRARARRPSTYFFPSWVSKDGINNYDFDLAKAKSLLDAAKFDYSKPVVWLSWNAAAADRQAFIQDCQSKMKTIGVNIEVVNGLDVTNALGAAGQWDIQMYGGYPIIDPDQIRQFTECNAIGTTPGKASAKFPDGAKYL